MRLLTITTMLSATTLAMMSQPAQAAWREASSAHFVIYADKDESTLQAFAQNLERYHAAMTVLTGAKQDTPSPSNRVTIYSVGSVAQVRKLYGEDASRYLGGFYQPRAGATIAIVPDISSERVSDWDASLRILLHEYAHHFLIGSSRYAMPRWASEGAAEFFSSASFDKDGAVNIGRPNLIRMLETNYLKDIPLEELFSSSLTPGAAPKSYDTFYARSWLLYHYLAMTRDRQGQLQRYLEAVTGGESSLEAAKQSFGDLVALDRALVAYAGKSRFTTIKIKGTVLNTGEVKVRVVSAGEAETMMLRIQQRRGIDQDVAPAIAQQMRTFAAQFPQDAQVLAALAEAELDAGNEAAAVDAADAALAVDRLTVNAHVQKCLALMAQTVKSSGPEDMEKLRMAIVALNRLENDHPLPLILYYQSFARFGSKPSPVAMRGLERAAELAPFDFGLRMTLAMQQLRNGRTEDARHNLIPVAYNPHGGRLTEQARHTLDRLTQGIKILEPSETAD